jgi:prepilin-type N-terminal cleavage/methylation domain-containing protein
MKSSTSSKSGFTLVEIMIVVSIICLFAAIAVPNFVQARTPSQRTTCINNLRQINSAVQMWALEQNAGFNASVSFTDIKPYLKSSLICPAGGTSFSDSYALESVTNMPTCISSGGGAVHGHVLTPDTSN